MTLYVHRPDMCFGHKYQCIVCVWLLFIQQAFLPYPDHGWPVFYPMVLGIGGSTSKGLGPLRAHSANSFFGKKEHPSRTLLGGNEGLSRLFTGFHVVFKGFHGVPRAFKVFHRLFHKKSKVLDGFYFWTCLLSMHCLSMWCFGVLRLGNIPGSTYA